MKRSSLSLNTVRENSRAIFSHRLPFKKTEAFFILRFIVKSGMAKLKLDLHDIYNRGDKIECELNRIVQEAVEKRIALVEIISGKGSGQLKKKVLRFLNQKHIRTLYHRVEKDSKNFGRIFIHFRH
ncbi:MAG: Smr/MutS family protein [Anaerolineales bacterium]|nr:Smr/MutS family protein [Anaerolineales bacterium]